MITLKEIEELLNLGERLYFTSYEEGEDENDVARNSGVDKERIKYLGQFEGEEESYIINDIEIDDGDFVYLIGGGK